MRVKSYISKPTATGFARNSRPIQCVMDLRLRVVSGAVVVELHAPNKADKKLVERERSAWWTAREISNAIRVLAKEIDSAPMMANKTASIEFDETYKSFKYRIVHTGETFFEVYEQEARVLLEALKGLCADMLLAEDENWRPRNGKEVVYE